jgi:hypothetical protein
MVLGYLGQTFGRLLQAMISRRRERLADASAVRRRVIFTVQRSIAVRPAAGPRGVSQKNHFPGSEYVYYQTSSRAAFSLFASR